MKETTLSCLNLFHTTTSLMNDYQTRGCALVNTKKRTVTGANLCEGVFVAQGNPQCLDTHFVAAVGAFPYIGKAAKSDRSFTDSGEIP